MLETQVYVRAGHTCSCHPYQKCTGPGLCAFCIEASVRYRRSQKKKLRMTWMLCCPCSNVTSVAATPVPLKGLNLDHFTASASCNRGSWYKQVPDSPVIAVLVARTFLLPWVLCCEFGPCPKLARPVLFAYSRV